MMKMARAATVMLLLCVLACSGSEPGTSETVEPAPAAPVRDEAADLEQGREYSRFFYAGEMISLHTVFTEEMRLQFSLNTLVENRLQIEQQLGAEVEVVREDVRYQDGTTLYARVGRFENTTDLYELQWAWKDGAIVGYVFKPPHVVPVGSE